MFVGFKEFMIQLWKLDLRRYLQLQFNEMFKCVFRLVMLWGFKEEMWVWLMEVRGEGGTKVF